MIDDNRLVAGIELGGTKCIALIARGREIVEIVRFPTRAPAATLAALADAIEGWQAVHGKAAAIGIGSFGPIGLDPRRADHGHITTSPKPGWRNIDMVGAFAGRFGVPVAFDTDVAGAALAEQRWGAAQGCAVAVYLTVGTGIGAGIVIDGVPLHGLIHPEFGHIRVRRAPGDDFIGICPFHGDCLEGIASGPALAARTGRIASEIADDDPVWDRLAGELGEAMAILMLALSPQRILIGGGVSQNRPGLIAAIRARTADRLGGYPAGGGAVELAEVIRSPALGDMAGPLGAVALAYRA